MRGPRKVESSPGQDHHFFQPRMGFLTLQEPGAPSVGSTKGTRIFSGEAVNAANCHQVIG